MRSIRTRKHADEFDSSDRSSTLSSGTYSQTDSQTDEYDSSDTDGSVPPLPRKAVKASRPQASASVREPNVEFGLGQEPLSPPPATPSESHRSTARQSSSDTDGSVPPLPRKAVKASRPQASTSAREPNVEFGLGQEPLSPPPVTPSESHRSTAHRSRNRARRAH